MNLARASALGDAVLTKAAAAGLAFFKLNNQADSHNCICLGETAVACIFADEGPGEFVCQP